MSPGYVRHRRSGHVLHGPMPWHRSGAGRTLTGTRMRRPVEALAGLGWLERSQWREVALPI